ncbi:MAG: hypothetical protein IJR02_12690 [Bacteroidaceae bacterium]|nr:hypothetical protein [Bacteroidaceae bacterium]
MKKGETTKLLGRKVCDEAQKGLFGVAKHDCGVFSSAVAHQGQNAAGKFGKVGKKLYICS